MIDFSGCRDTVDFRIRFELMFSGLSPTDYTSILYVTDKGGNVLYDGQVAPLYREHRQDILNLSVDQMYTLGDPIPILYHAIISESTD